MPIRPCHMAFSFFVPLLSMLFCTVKASETSDRAAQFLLAKQKVSDHMSVDVRAQGILENSDSSINTFETLQRILICDEGRRYRLDGEQGNLTSESPKFNLRESLLFLKDKALYVNFLEPMPQIKNFQVREGVSEVRTQTKRKHPFDLATGNLGSSMIEGEMGLFSCQFSVIAESELADGKFKSVVLLSNNLGAREVIFSKDPNWTPLSIKYFSRREAKLPTGRKVEEKDIYKWTHTCTTTAEWTRLESELDEELFVPRIIRIDSDKDNKNESREYVFLNWNVGEVDPNLFDEAVFTRDNIPKQIDFEKLRRTFDERK